jgi:hypothetical protein
MSIQSDVSSPNVLKFMTKFFHFWLQSQDSTQLSIRNSPDSQVGGHLIPTPTPLHWTVSERERARERESWGGGVVVRDTTILGGTETLFSVWRFPDIAR